MRRIGVIAAAAFAAVLLSSGSASSARHACTWGASSITAEVVDGRIVQSAPVVTGCAP